jgi:hypothetical protein
MATVLRRVHPLCTVIRDSANLPKKQRGAVDIQRGTATLVSGTVTVSGVRLTAAARIVVTRMTKAGSVAHGLLEVPAGSRTTGAAGQFVINAISEAAGAVVTSDVSTVDWMVINEFPHNDISERTIVSPNATDLATSLTLINEILAVYEFHRVDDLAHKAADTSNPIAAPRATDLTTAQTLANELKADFNLHRAQAGVHFQNDGGNAITSADATDQSSLNTLANELKTDINAHFGAFGAPLDVTPSIRLVDA